MDCFGVVVGNCDGLHHHLFGQANHCGPVCCVEILILDLDNVVDDAIVGHFFGATRDKFTR